MASANNQARWSLMQRPQKAFNAIIGVAKNDNAVAEIGPDIMFCLKITALTSPEKDVATTAFWVGRGLAAKWMRKTKHRSRQRSPLDPDELLQITYGISSARFFGVSDEGIARLLETTTRSYSARELLGFKPCRSTSPRPAPVRCSCSQLSRCGAKRCGSCGLPIEYDSKFLLWQHALVYTHFGESIGVRPGSSYRSVARLRRFFLPYVRVDKCLDEDWRDCTYAVTHLLYTLTQYGICTLPTESFTQEQRFLVRARDRAYEEEDLELVAEATECLTLFSGYEITSQERKYRGWIAARQQKDGTWGTGDNWYDFFHKVWVGFDALRDWCHPGGLVSTGCLNRTVGAPPQRDMGMR